MIFNPNPLFYEMVRIFKSNYSPENKVIICNEGSSRSSKTWDFFHFLYLFCDHNSNQHNEIYILRETLANCKDYTLKEFKKCFQTMKVWDDDCFKTPQKPEYTLFGNEIYFRGLDDSAEGYPSDILFINEALENQNKEKVASLRMRCRKLIVMDWNPKYTQHWCFYLEGQENTFFTHSTYKNNKHLQKSVVKEIESYDPSNPENIRTGTADDYRWQVYGLGKRSAPEGVIFKNHNKIPIFPPELAFHYGMDFGFTVDPTAIIKYTETSTDIFLELLCYHPIETPEEIDLFADSIKLNKELPITADSSDKHTSEKHGTIEMVRSLKNLGWQIKKVSKTKSVMFWVNSMKKKKINIVDNDLYIYAKKEVENYRMKMINGIAINQPVDDFNHFWDASRYAHMAEHSNSSNFAPREE
jgi:PBSX family phage terminase large subunit